LLAGDISIRLIRDSDLDAYKALRLEALREHPEAFGTDYDEDLGQPESVWIDRLTNSIDNPGGCIALADAGGELAAMAGVFRRDSVKVRHVATIWGVYVRPKYRGQQLVDRMIAELLNWCRANQVGIVHLTVVTSNGPAIRCYLRCGFSVYGISPEEIRIGDKYYDELLMWRRI
jgi:RimJ/RimL family protein N-acetyltransferase